MNMICPAWHGACNMSPPMFFYVLAQILSFLLDLVAIACQSDHEQDLELLLLR